MSEVSETLWVLARRRACCCPDTSWSRRGCFRFRSGVIPSRRALNCTYCTLASVPDQILAAKVERRMAHSPAAEQAVDRGHSSALRVPRLHLPCAAAASCMLVLLRLASGVWRLASALTSVSLLAAAERRCQWAVPPISHGGTQHVRHTMVCKSRRRRFSV